MNRFERRRLKKAKQKPEVRGLDTVKTDATRNNIASALGAQMFRLFIYHPPFLLAYQAASRMEEGKPRFQEHEGFTVIF